MKKSRTCSRGRQRGYSLVELIVVVGIIGTFSLITVPAFVNYMRMAPLRNATRTFAGDLQLARTTAITESTNVTVTFGTNWYRLSLPVRRQAVQTLDQTLSIKPSAFAGTVTFRPNGTILNYPSSGEPEIVLTSRFDLPKNRTTYRISPSGSFSVKTSTVPNTP